MTYTQDVALEQVGTSVGGVWTDSVVGSSINVSPGALVGLLYSVPVTMTSAFSPPRALDPPIWGSAGPVTFTAGDIFGGTANLYLMANERPSLFSSSNLPSISGATLLSSFTLSSLFPPSVVTLTNAQNTTVRQTITSKTTWNGRLALVLDWSLGFGSSFTVTSFVGTVLERFFSGLLGGPYGGPARYVRDGRFAMPALASSLRRDGDQPGIFVRASDWDPEDPDVEYRPRPGEGSVNDDVPDL